MLQLNANCQHTHMIQLFILLFYYHLTLTFYKYMCVCVCLDKNECIQTIRIENLVVKSFKYMLNRIWLLVDNKRSITHSALYKKTEWKLKIFENNAKLQISE